jgi:hypothetical protein
VIGASATAPGRVRPLKNAIRIAVSRAARPRRATVNACSQRPRVYESLR